MLYSLTGDVVVCLVKLVADEIAIGVDTGNGCGAAAHTVVENHTATVGIGLNKVLDQGYGFLGGVKPVSYTHLTLPTKA